MRRITAEIISASNKLIQFEAARILKTAITFI